MPGLYNGSPVNIQDEMDEREELAAEARGLAEATLAKAFNGWVELDGFSVEKAYLYGAFLCALTLEASFDANGVRFRFPVLAENGAGDDARTWISYEQLLPDMDTATSRREVKWLADRLRNLAALCDKLTEEAK